MPTDYARLFGAEGPLAARIQGFQVREGQAAMAAAVERAIAHQGRLVVEAGTGTGKTLAYLVPALLSGRRILVSTGTKALQEQLFSKDLPLARAALGHPLRAALLKGRANYLCLHRLELAPRQAGPRPAQLRRLEEIRQWSATTRTGDLAEIGDTADGSSLWPLVSSTNDNCLGGECPRYADCHVVKARLRARDAEVVVVNHHLLFADLAGRQEGMTELLPDADALILDEAHQIAETASMFFGRSLGRRQLDDLGADVRAEYESTARDTPRLELLLREVERAARGLDTVLPESGSRSPWPALSGNSRVQEGVTQLGETLTALEDLLGSLSGRSRGLESCRQRCAKLQRELAHVTGNSSGVVRWVERYAQGFAFNATPLNIADRFREFLEQQPGAWIFTSATLTVNNSFAHFSARLGLPEPDTLMLESPFDYRRNALIYLPSSLPDPASPEYTARVVGAALPLIEASGGGAFLLCTSHRALREASALLRGRVDLTVLAQGESGRAELLERFRADGHAVLVGTSSFWEGVDVRGPALRLVVIDKLPFSSPGDPVLQARLEALQEEGHDPFRSFQLPQAVISLKQGAGRLIRDAADRGVLMLCDPRLRSRPYGKIFLRSLPPMPVTDEEERARAFFLQKAAA